MEESMKDSGQIISFMGLEFINGQTVVNMMVCIAMIRKKVMVLILGLMAESMKEIGRTESNMVKASSRIPKARASAAFGKMAIVYGGLIRHLTL
jgi:hypothetical protein